ncbi:MAG: GNAT family N-acetyltransferase [Anaerolineae bacterium]|nr:GNAT family N-acetyltransferase [Anaerolineae bacterium]
MLKLNRFTDAAQFYARAESFWMRHEAAHCLSIGITVGQIHNLNQYSAQPTYMALVEDEAGEIVLTALRTPPRDIILSLTDHPEALDLVARDAHQEYGTLPGVQSVIAVSQQFAERWTALTGAPARLEMPERIYQISQVRPPVGVPGMLRRANSGDRQRFVAWMKAFEAEAFGAAVTPLDRFETWFDSALDAQDRGTYLWEDAANGGCVSMACNGGPTPNGMRIGPVYTPPEKRGRGYGSAATAEVSRLLLESGRKFCFLYTDLRNPTSNKIYQQIGYEPVIDCGLYRFDAG